LLKGGGRTSSRGKGGGGLQGTLGQEGYSAKFPGELNPQKRGDVSKRAKKKKKKKKKKKSKPGEIHSFYVRK